VTTGHPLREVARGHALEDDALVLLVADELGAPEYHHAAIVQRVALGVMGCDQAVEESDLDADRGTVAERSHGPAGLRAMEAQGTILGVAREGQHGWLSVGHKTAMGHPATQKQVCRQFGARALWMAANAAAHGTFSRPRMLSIRARIVLVPTTARHVVAHGPAPLLCVAASRAIVPDMNGS